jgi:metal-responsive CopG/Arc/MetJ family transcriptional regulator
MKVAVSIPDPLFKSAERLAKRLKKPRSRLYAEALAHYVAAQDDPQAITDNLNEVYGKIDSRVDPAFARAQAETLDDETW